MLALVLDTCTEKGVVGIFRDDTPLFVEELPTGYQSSKYLLPAIERGLSDAGVKPKELTYIGVGIGPGSYTGIRLGVVVAKTFAFACECPLIGICTLEGFVPETDGPFAAILDAKISGVYLLMGNQVDGMITYQSKPEVVSLDELPEKLKGIQTLVTPTMNPLRNKIDEGPQAWQETPPNIERFAYLSRRRYEAGDYKPGTDLELIYLRKTQAEIEKGL